MKSKLGQSCVFTQWEHVSIPKIDWARLSSHRTPRIGTPQEVHARSAADRPQTNNSCPAFLNPNRPTR